MSATPLFGSSSRSGRLDQDPGVVGTALLFSESRARQSAVVNRIVGLRRRCVVAHDADRARWLATVRNFELIVVAADSCRWGREALGVLRPVTRAPVLVLSADGPATQPVLLRLGADAVLDGGCDRELFEATVEALVRRSSAKAPSLRYLESEGLTVDLWARRAVMNGDDVGLTPTEFDILQLLMTRSQIPVKHHDIVKSVWNWKYADQRNALRLQINRLRRKLADVSGGRSEFIRVIRGIGYVFDKAVLEFADVDGATATSTVRESANQLLESTLRRLIKELIACDTRLQACTLLAEQAIAEGMCDGAAVFVRRPGHDALDLVAHAGMPTAWQLEVAGGLPLDEQFVATHTFKTDQIHQYVDIFRMVGRFRSTVRLKRHSRLGAHMSVPLTDQNGTWGQVGFSRRSDDPFTTQDCMVLESAAAVLGAMFPDQPLMDFAVS